MLIPPFPTNSRDYVEQMIHNIGRNVTFYNVVSVSGCLLCSLDPVSETSTDSYCPSCGGEYWIPTYSGTVVSGYVIWGKSEDKHWVTGGIVDDGDCKVQVLYSQELENIIYSSQYVIVDDREMDLDKIYLRGVPEINRIWVVLKEKEK